MTDAERAVATVRSAGITATAATQLDASTWTIAVTATVTESNAAGPTTVVDHHLELTLAMLADGLESSQPPRSPPVRDRTHRCTTSRQDLRRRRRKAARPAATASLVTSWAGPITIIVALALVLAGCTGLMLLAGGAGSAPPGCAQSFVAPAGNERILATIRTVESGGRYDVRITTSTASGAYAFIDAAWRHYAASVGVDVATYPSAWMAPHDAQDATANAYVNEILAANDNDVSAVPIAWYLPRRCATRPSWTSSPPAATA